METFEKFLNVILFSFVLAPKEHINFITTEKDFEFLALSTQDDFEVCENPDSKKIMVAKLSKVFQLGSEVEYMKDELDPERLCPQDLLRTFQKNSLTQHLSGNDSDPIQIIKTYYDRQAAGYQTSYEDEIHKKQFDRDFLDKLRALLPPRSRVLDVGCASSCQQARYLGQFFDITAIDLSPKNVALARHRYPELDVREMNMLSMNFQDAEFDGLNAFYSIIHIPSRHLDALFNEFSRVLRSDGMLSIAVHKGEFEGLVENENVYFTAFSAEKIVRHLEENSFRVIFLTERAPIYEFEYQSDRLYIIAQKS